MKAAVTTLPEPVYEIALYEVNANTNGHFLELNRATIEQVATYEGYLKSETYRSLTNPNLYLDVMLWESLDLAVKAQETFEQDPRTSGYMQTIDSVYFFDHVRAIKADAFMRFHELDDDDILEFASIQVKDRALEPFFKSRKSLIRHIGNSYEAFKEVETVQSVYDPHSIIDLAKWDNAEACGIAQRELESHELFGPFASSFDMEHEMIMDFFTRVR